MDEIMQAVEDLKKEWKEASAQIQQQITSIEACGGRGTAAAATLSHLNGAARDGLALLQSLKFKLEFLSQQLPTPEEEQTAHEMLESWKDQY